MAPLLMTFCDLEGHFCCLKLSISDTSNMQCVLSTIRLHMNRKALVAGNFNCLFENEGLLKVTASHVHCKCGNISGTVADTIVVTTDHL